VQWHWKKHYFPELVDQFNSIHEQLIQSWTTLKPYLKGETLHFSCVKESLEDLTNLEYLRDTAIQAGIQTKLIYIDEIGWADSQFVDLEGEPIQSIFKLYPWEWMVREEFGKNICLDIHQAQWIEPSWKMLLSNKAILPILWELFPNHPHLLAAYFEEPEYLQHFVKKPLLNCSLVLFLRHFHGQSLSCLLLPPFFQGLLILVNCRLFLRFHLCFLSFFC